MRAMRIWSPAASAMMLGAAFAACSSESPDEPVAPPPGVDASVNVGQAVDDAGEATRTRGDAGDAGKSVCLQRLDAAGIAWEPTVARGVEEAVFVKSAINGIRFTKDDTDAPADDPMACSFVLTLMKFADYLKTKGVVQVGTLGSYCYRCCCAWSPTNDCRSPTDPEPDCGQNGYSNHSWGRAIDVRYIVLASGVRYDIDDPKQWVAGSSSTTCTSGLAKQTGVSKVLYGMACDVASRGIFDTILTPNYNADHRNHWHMDIGKPGTTIGTTNIKSITVEPTPVDALGAGADVCGGG